MRAIVLTAAVVLAGGTSAAAATWQDEEKKVAACFVAMDAAPELQVVNAKFARRDPTPAQLSDRTIASEGEATALRLRIAKTRPCRELRLAAVDTHHPLLKPAYETLYYQADQVFDYLQQRAIPYGIANRLSAEALDLFRARERTYPAAPEDERRVLADLWLEQLQQGHSYPPPQQPQSCAWQALNIVCE